MRRVVITGIGAVTPLAGNIETTWARLIEGKSGIKTIDKFDTEDLPVKIAGVIPRGEGADEFNPDDYMLPKERRRIDDFILYGVAAAAQAIQDAGWTPEDEESRIRTGVMIGSGIGGLTRIYDTSVALYNGGFKKVSPFFIPGSLINLVSGYVSINYGFQGPNHAPVTACATGSHAIGDAARIIQYGDADVMVAGGAEAAVDRIGMSGFASMRALSTSYNDTPEKASRPWDEGRDGFVMGEGSGIVVVEELEHAKKRGAKIYAEVVGYGMSGDAYHITAPHSEGKGGFRAMQTALKHAKISPDEIGYVNAHGTSTPLGDAIELAAVKRLFAGASDNVSMSSTKSSTGHLLGAAGSLEAIFSILAMRDSILPPTLNLENPLAESEGFDLVPLKAKEKKLKYVLSNSFGFGGTNPSLVMKKFEE